MSNLPPQELKKIQSRIAKLLALAASPNENEAAVALGKANELMTRHRIASIDIDPVRKTVDTNDVFVESHGDRARIPKWVGLLSAELCDIFDCIGVTRMYPGRWVGITFVGGASDVQILADLYNRLRHIIGNMGRKYIEENKGSKLLTPKSRETYCTGVVLTVVKRIRAMYRPPGTDLILLKKEFVKKHCDHLFPEVKSAKFAVNVTENTDVLSLQRGLADGESVRINKSIKND